MEKREFEYGDVISFDYGIKNGADTVKKHAVGVIGKNGEFDLLYCTLGNDEIEDTVKWDGQTFESLKCSTEWCTCPEYVTSEEFTKTMLLIHEYGANFTVLLPNKIFITKIFGYDIEELVTKYMLDDAEYNKFVFEEKEEAVEESQIDNRVATLTPSQQAFCDYLTEIHKYYVTNETLEGSSKIRSKHRISGLTGNDFYNCALDSDKEIDYNSYGWKIYCAKLYAQVKDKNCHLYIKWGILNEAA